MLACFQGELVSLLEPDPKLVGVVKALAWSVSRKIFVIMLMMLTKVSVNVLTDVGFVCMIYRRSSKVVCLGSRFLALNAVEVGNS